MSTVAISIGGVDQAADVVFASCHFESSVNGIAGEAKFRVRDLNRTKSFGVGAPLLLEIDGDAVWRGFVMSATRTYVFPALNVSDFGLPRFVDIVGSDVNILLTKRIVFDQSDGANILAPLLPAHTADTTALTELFADWLDLSDDGIDTTTLVENVGDTMWTQEGRAWEGSDTWGQAVASIANLPAAIYYIDPDKNFVYTDVDTPDAPFGLSDQPDGTTTKGYSEMEVLFDGTGLANDVMAWGAGYGSQKPVFTRDIDATSVTDHGVWQMGQTTFGVFKQATIDRIAESIIDGSPQSKRGAKNDRVAVQCVTYEPGLRVAQKVDFTSNVFGFNDVIPIRKMAIDFDGPLTPKYSLTLSHEIDTPFSFFDPFLFPRFRRFHRRKPILGSPSDDCVFRTFEGFTPGGINEQDLPMSGWTEDQVLTKGWSESHGDSPIYTLTPLNDPTVTDGEELSQESSANIIQHVALTTPLDFSIGTVHIRGSIYWAPISTDTLDGPWGSTDPFDDKNYMEFFAGIVLIESGGFSVGGLEFEAIASIRTAISGTRAGESFDPTEGGGYNFHIELDVSHIYAVVWQSGAEPAYTQDRSQSIANLSGIDFRAGAGARATNGEWPNYAPPPPPYFEEASYVYSLSDVVITQAFAGSYDPAIDVGPYTAGRITVFVDGTEISVSGSPHYEEAGPTVGIVYVYGLTNGQIVEVCKTSVGIPSNAWVCEQFEVVTTTLTLTHPFLALSPQVWVDGLFQLQSTYTMDPLAGTITFGFTPGPTALARVCYWSLL